MIITKDIETGLDLPNPILVYSNLNASVMGILRSRFENRCYKECLILKINKIKAMSDCIIAHEGNRTYGKIAVTFEVEALIYAIGEPIHGCKVTSRDQKNMIICKSDYANIFLNNHTQLSSIQIGQIISIRVGAIKYLPGSTSININAYPYYKHPDPILYHINIQQWNDKEMAFMEPIVSKIKELEEEVNKIKKEEKFKFFKSLIYAYKNPPADPSNSLKISLFDILSQNGDKLRGYYCRDVRLPLDEPVVYYFQVEPSADLNYKAENCSSLNSLVAIFEDYYENLKTLVDLYKIYNTDLLVESHKNVWLIFVKNKK